MGCFGDWDLEKFWGLEVESIWDALKVRSDETTMEVTQSSQEGLPGLSGDASCVSFNGGAQGSRYSSRIFAFMFGSCLAHN